MPLGVKPECIKCGVRESPLWHTSEAGSVCNDCLEPRHPPHRSEETTDESGKSGRKSTRVTRYGCKQSLKLLPKGKVRRHIFKKTVRCFLLKIY